jgi:hypothetical protein
MVVARTAMSVSFTYLANWPPFNRFVPSLNGQIATPYLGWSNELAGLQSVSHGTCSFVMRTNRTEHRVCPSPKHHESRAMVVTALWDPEQHNSLSISADRNGSYPKWPRCDKTAVHQHLLRNGPHPEGVRSFDLPSLANEQQNKPKHVLDSDQRNG